MAQGDLHIVGVANNTIWHTILFANGSCQNFFGNVNSQQSNSGSLDQIYDVDCAADGANLLHVVAATSTGLWHTYRQANGNSSSWQGFFGDVNQQENNASQPGTFQQVSAAAGGGELQLTLTSNVAGPWHTIRYENGNWKDSYGDIHSQIPEFQNSSSIACASDNVGNIYAVGNQKNTFGYLKLSIRNYWSGIWSEIPVWQPDRPDPSNSFSSSLSVSFSFPHTVYIAGLGGAYASFDVIQNTGDGWYTLARALTSPPPQNITETCCVAMPNGDLVFVVVAQSTNPNIGMALYSVRLSNGQWQPWMCINDQMKNGAQVGAFSKVGISVVPTN